jgi:hypothetical protein
MPRLRRVMSSCGRSIVAGQSWRLVFRSGTVESQLGFFCQTKHAMAAAAVYGDRRAVNAGHNHMSGGVARTTPHAGGAWHPSMPVHALENVVTSFLPAQVSTQVWRRYEIELRSGETVPCMTCFELCMSCAFELSASCARSCPGYTPVLGSLLPSDVARRY